MSTEPRTPFAARCKTCRHVWAAIWFPASMDRLPRKITCPACGETKSTQLVMASAEDAARIPPPLFSKEPTT